LTLEGLKEILPKIDENKLITIVDIGCGNGDMLRKIADFGIQNNHNFKLIGIDANAYTVNHARNLSSNYHNIRFLCEDIFSMIEEKMNCDIIVCTLTLHHFKELEIITILKVFKKCAKLGIIINDLQRNAVAYRLFQLLCVTFNLNKMSREDGLTSILRGFKKEELVAFSDKLNFNKYSIQWKWAFRYQWIIQNI